MTGRTSSTRLPTPNLRSVEPPPDRVLTIPNAISVVRLACIPLFLVMLFGHDNRYGAAWLLAVLGCTDWIDGWMEAKERAWQRRKR